VLVCATASSIASGPLQTSTALSTVIPGLADPGPQGSRFRQMHARRGEHPEHAAPLPSSAQQSQHCQ
jgi:hypothetical protein